MSVARASQTPALIAPDILARSHKILFIAHLAIGDFTYLQNDFRAFAQAFPHLQVDLWVDEVRRTDNATQWPHLKSYVLYDWAEGCGLFGKVYRDTYSPALYAQSIQTAQAAHYPIVVSLATLRPHLYARLARQIAGTGMALGMRAKTGLFQLHYPLAYRSLDATIAPHPIQASPNTHISGVYADWFRQLAGITVTPPERFPFVDVPAQWTAGALRQLSTWDIDPAVQKLVFINPYAKTKKRCWPLEHVAELIRAMQGDRAWRDSAFVVNAVPQELANARALFDSRALPRTHLFSAEQSFYELPALLAQCTLIISVETAVMHLANAVHVPVIALMRQKNPEWVPIDTAHSTVITTTRRRHWVRDISVAQVMQTIEETTPCPTT